MLAKLDYFNMAPTDSSLVDQLKSTVEALEKRIVDLEGKLAGEAKSALNGVRGGSDGMRMILIGPPGAGMLFFNQSF